MPVLLVENNIVAADLKDNWSVYLPVMLLSFVGMYFVNTCHIASPIRFFVVSW
jgi:hypothetical protein